MRESEGQGKRTQTYCQVAQNKVCPAYARRADVKASRFQKCGKHNRYHMVFLKKKMHNLNLIMRKH